MKAIKNTSKLLTVVLFVIVVLIVNKDIISFSNDTEYYVASTGLNVRTGPGTQHSVIFSLQKGNEVEVLSKNNKWFQIKYLEKRGYVYSEYLEYSRAVSNTSLQSLLQIINFFVKGIIASIVLIIFLLIFRKVRDVKLLKTVTKTKRGTRSERSLVLELLKFGIPAQMIFHDLYLRKNNDEFSQIDLVVLTDVGILVFEVKDYSGWIYGAGNQAQWTKVLAYGKRKYRFYNPIMQNNKHINELKKNLSLLNNLPFYSIVVFYGNCQLKDVSFISRGTYLVKSNRIKDVMKIILNDNEIVEYNKNEVVVILKESVENGEYKENQIKHIENIKGMIGKDRIFE